jgi:L-threonylcarbamoyladenylate synthase
MNIAEKEFAKLLAVLNDGGTILYPTDTIWGVGCDATNTRAVEKVYKVKERISNKSFIILVKDLEMLSNYVSSVPEIVVELLASISEPLTVIYPNGKNLPKNVVAGDGSIAIRIPDHAFCQQLLGSFGRPLISTSANLSGGNLPYSFRSIDNQIKKSVDYIVTVEQNMIARPKPSTIIRIDDDSEIHILRN